MQKTTRIKVLDHISLMEEITKDFGLSPAATLIKRHSIRKIYASTKYLDGIPFINNRPDMQGKMFTMDFSDGCGVLFISPPRSGKTFAIRGLVCELLDAGYFCFNIADLKNDYFYCKYPIQKKFWKFLPAGRQPRGYNVIGLVPRYMVKAWEDEDERLVTDRLEPDMVQFSIPFREFEPEYLINLLNIEFASAQDRLLRFVWGGKSGHNKPKTPEELKTRLIHWKNYVPNIESLKLIDVRTVGALVSQIEFLIRQEFFSDSYSMDIVDLLLQGKFPTFCLFGDADRWRAMHQTYILHFCRTLYKELQYGRLKGSRLVLISDDVGALVMPRREEPMCKRFLLDNYMQVSAQYGGYFIFGTQYVELIPDALLGVKHIIFFAQIKGEDRDAIARARRMTPAELEEEMYSKKTVPKKIDSGPYKGIRFVLWIDDNNNAIYGAVPPPAAMHQEQR